MIAILTAIASLLPLLLPSLGISGSLDTLISAALNAAVVLVEQLTSKTGTTSVDVVLTSLQAALTALEADTSIDPLVMGDISEGLSVLKAAITAYTAAQTTTDPSSLGPVPELT
jgi:hypothetical protein